MTVTPGTRLGPYEIVSRIGAGGMGEVFKARDTRLDRNVAIKVLPEAFANDVKLKVRFEREARTISQLNHPNICTLHDVGENYLVMELLEGETLADRLARGPLPLAEVLRLGAQIADALGRAHRAGVVHRDLKPGNVMLTKAGAKLLDFGLARATATVVDLDGATQQKPLTQEGTILGTFQYMAPEQLEGADAGARTDIFAFGAVLYEMITGKRAFEGKSKTSLIAAIVSGEPVPLAQMQPFTPRELEHVVARCLAKDPEERWESAHDIAQELRWIAERAPETSAPRSRRREWIAWSVAALGLALIAALLVLRPEEVPPRAIHLSFSPPENASLYPFDELGLAVSPDGSRIAYAAFGPTRRKQLWIRDLASSDSRSVPGTEGATYPVWSPDGTQLVFFADGKLKKVAAAGGSPAIIADASEGRGVAWGAGGIIAFSQRPTDGIFRTTPGGGVVTRLTSLGPNDMSHRWPSISPDGRHLLFVNRERGASDSASGTLNVLVIESGKVKQIATRVANGVFLARGRIAFGRGGTVFAQRFDEAALALTGEPVPIVAGGVSNYEAKNLTMYSVSPDGTLAYIPATPDRSEVALVDRAGREVERITEATGNPFARLSDDGRRIVYVRRESDGKHDIWIYDRTDSRTSRVTFEGRFVRMPVWSPDGNEIVFQYGEPLGELARKRIDRGGPPEKFVTSAQWKLPRDYSADGRWFVWEEQTKEGMTGIQALSLDGRGKPFLFVANSASCIQPRFSPDARFVIYASDASGRNEIYVKSFPGGGEQWQISTDGGVGPLWRGDGSEIFYTALDGTVMAVPVSTAPRFRFGSAQPLFMMNSPVLDSDDDSPVSDVSRDGKLFLVRRSARPREQIEVILGALPRVN